MAKTRTDERLKGEKLSPVNLQTVLMEVILSQDLMIELLNDSDCFMCGVPFVIFRGCFKMMSSLLGMSMDPTSAILDFVSHIDVQSVNVTDLDSVICCCDNVNWREALVVQARTQQEEQIESMAWFWGGFQIT